MRILLVGGASGSDTGGAGDWKQACRVVGEKIGVSDAVELAVCSCYPDSADAHVLRGFADTGGHARRLFIFHPASPELADEWRRTLQQHGLKDATVEQVAGPDPMNPNTRSNAYFLAQLSAMRKCQVILAIGGQTGGSAHLLLSVAASEGMSILPYEFAGGAARELYRVHRSRLQDVLGDGIDDLTEYTGVETCIESARRLRAPSLARRPYVFISYSWSRQSDADVVETELRRRGFSLFRDEKEIPLGADISRQLQRALDECTHFIGLWCAQYACSPHCYDEFHYIIERQRRDDHLRVVMLRLDETRYAWKSMRSDPDRAPNWPLAMNRKDLRVAIGAIFSSPSHESPI